MKGFYRIAVATPRLHLGNTEANLDEHVRLSQEASGKGVSVLAFPELSITGYTCGDLFFRTDLLDAANAALSSYARKTMRLPLVSIVGFPERKDGNLYNAAAVVAGGEVVGIIRKRTLANYAEYYEKRQFDPAPVEEPMTVFEADGLRFSVEICEDLWFPIPPSSRMSGVDVVFNLSASTDFLGKATVRNGMVLQQSARLGCVYALAAAGIGESTSDALYGGGSLIAEAGRAVAEMPLFSEGGILTADADVEALRYRRRAKSSVRAMAADVTSSSRLIKVDCPHSDAARPPRLRDMPISSHPFMDEFGEPGWIDKLLTIQAVALARRMEAAHVTKLVLGLSGGADSALALLGARRAIDRLAHNSNNRTIKQSNNSLLAIVMPGLASSEKTQRRAIALAKALGVEVRVIDICEACRQHLKDIGHDETVHDIVFENVQARERTQVLMDLANQEGALVVGTGDLSEIALGWNTYNGDHMSMYQINASVPKTMVLAALKGVATLCKGRSAALLREIAEAPITPELVPGAAVGDSEARLGPYELHDLFLYHFLANGASRNKLKVLGKIAFRGRYDEATVERTCETFWRRFFTSQYKRNCVPDGPKITLSLSPRADWRMPSDAEMT